jgi:hypothetical protein
MAGSSRQSTGVRLKLTRLSPAIPSRPTPAKKTACFSPAPQDWAPSRAGVAGRVRLWWPARHLRSRPPAPSRKILCDPARPAGVSATRRSSGARRVFFLVAAPPAGRPRVKIMSYPFSIFIFPHPLPFSGSHGCILENIMMHGDNDRIGIGFDHLLPPCKGFPAHNTTGIAAKGSAADLLGRFIAIAHHQEQDIADAK